MSELDKAVKKLRDMCKFPTEQTWPVIHRYGRLVMDKCTDAREVNIVHGIMIDGLIRKSIHDMVKRDKVRHENSECV